MHNQHEIPILEDPIYNGIFIVKNLIPIIALLFSLLGVTAFITASLTQIDISLRVNAAALETCVQDSTQCITATLTRTQAEAISIDDPVYLEIASDQDHRRHLISGTVTQNDALTASTGEALDKKITIKTNEADIDKQKIISAIIIIGRQSAWNASVAAFLDMI